MVVIGRALKVFEQLLNRISCPSAVFNGLANLKRQFNRAAHSRPLGVSAGHRVTTEHDRQSHAHRHGAADILGGFGRIGFHQNAFHLIVGDDHGCDGHAVDIECHHLNFGKCAAHAISIDEGYATFRRHGDRQGRIDAADFASQDVGGFFAGSGFQF